jgi:NAD(P)-dependent dehydrogenase (short-subunit alcohol dehydrogenase family)
MVTEQKPLPSWFGARTTAEEALGGIELRGKVAIVTGGHAGLGLETTRVLSNAGATVIVGSCDTRKAQAAVAKMKNVEVGQLDLGNPDSIDRFAEGFQRSNRALNLLINNAGVMATPLTRDERGYELQFATNHLGHFQLTARLWEALKNSSGARVVALSSCIPAESSPTSQIYDRRRVKRARHLSRKWRGQGSGCHQGSRAFENSRGAATTIWAAVSPQLNGKGGVNCEDCDIAQLVPADSDLNSGVRPWAVDEAAAEALWTLSESFLKTSVSTIDRVRQRAESIPEFLNPSIPTTQQIKGARI